MSDATGRMKKRSIRAFSTDELKSIEETLEQYGSPADRLFYSFIMLTGMRASQCLSINAEDLVSKSDYSINVKNVTLPNMNAKSKRTLLNFERAQKGSYVSPCNSVSNSGMKLAKLPSELSSWLSTVNVFQGGRLPHGVRLSVIAANIQAMNQPTMRNDLVISKTNPGIIQHYIHSMRPPKT